MMRTNRLNLWLAPAVFGWIAALPVYAVDNAASSADKTGRDVAAVHAGARSSIRLTDADPDGKPVVIRPPREVAAGQSGDCQVIGGFETLFQGRGRYRANIYRVEFTDAVLTEIRMELSFNGTVDLHFSFHRALSDAMEQVFRRDEGMDDCVVTDANGTGAPQFYSCTLLTPLTLEPGFDYAIGAAWGNNDVTYGRDTRNYPLPFLHGQVLGLVLINASPPVDDELQFSVIFGGGAYSMQLCFDPVRGACCIPPDQGDPGGRCEDLLPSACTDPRGFFHGQRTTCARLGSACVFGACCDLCGGCFNNFTPEACRQFVDGVWQGAGVECTGSLCPATTGACCFPKSPCEELCERDCAAGGTYRGDGTTCDPDPCQGACCIPGFCFDETPVDCADRNGTYKGDGTTCATLPPGNECGGACCRGAFDSLDFCEDVSRRSLCTFEDFPVSAYLGDGAFCPSDPTDPEDGCGSPADYATCCLPGGLCINTTPAFCEQPWVAGVSGVLGSTCNSTTCPLGACCLEDGSCQLLTQSACPTNDWTGVDQGGTCEPNDCVVPVGACCLTDATGVASCEVLTEAECLGRDGLYQGDDPGADPCSGPSCEPFGACCRPNGTCTDGVTAIECRDLGGVVPDNLFLGQNCNSPNMDCPPLGACCSPQGNCSFILQDVCQTSGGSFVGEGALCTAEICPSGACCTAPDGSDCVQYTESACLALGDHYFGDDTTCSDKTVVCPNAEGACCLGGGSCRDLLLLDCSAAGGHYQGPGTACAEEVCVPGACCLADHSCLPDQVLLQCAAEGGEFHAETSCAVPGLCDPTGACCNGGACTIEAEINCTDAGGVYQGDDTVCEPGLCTLGACCHLDGTCEDDAVASQCIGANDLFHPGLLCVNVCIPRGACCIEGEECQLLPELLCENRAGVYDGDAAKCRANLCTPGACCLPDETCNDTLTLQSCESDTTGGTYLGPGAVCADADCTRGSCCAADATCTDDRVLLRCADPNDFRPGATCVPGACEAGTSPCGDGVDCTVDSCNEATDSCDHTPNDALCDNGQFCDGIETCHPLLGCQAGTPVDCSDGIDCTADACNETTNTCEHIPDDAECDDGLFCNGVEICNTDTGTCTAGTDPCAAGGTCDENNDMCEAPCTTDADCDDGLFCNGRETCVDGTCQAGTGCNDGVACTVDSCNEGTESCGNVPDDALCDNGQFCDGIETCRALLGCQAGTPVDCSDGIACTADLCNETTNTCVHIPDDALCDNAFFCDGAEFCDPSFRCRPGSDPCPGPLVCDEAGDRCVGCAANADCNDGLFCNGAETCTALECVGRGACCRPSGEPQSCRIQTRLDCLGSGGTLYLGDATTCGPPSPCINIDSSDPPNCAVDARQPSDPDGSNPVGWDSIEITFNGDTTGLSDVDFTVSLDPGPGDPPTIVGVSTTGNTATLELNPPIPAGQWTCFTHDAGGTSTCLGFLPADSDGDGVSAGADIQRLIDCISDVAACELWECDLDRSGLCGPADILRGVDLLNGAAQYARWIDAPPLPFCPSGQ